MMTMMMSIAHRITGAAVYFAMLLLVWWLMAAAAGPNAYAILQGLMGSIIGQLILIGCTWALLHHALGGIRHLIWDIGYGFEPTEREWLAMRAKDLTSTEAAALFDASPYMTEFELNCIKTGKLPKDFEENDRMKWGSRLEGAIAAGIAEDYGLIVEPFKVYMRIPELRMGSSFDFKIVGIVEGHEDNAARAMFALVEARHGLAGDPRQQAVHRLDQHDLAPQSSQNCRRLEADIAAADHRDPVRAHQLVEQPIHLVAVADIVDAAKIGAGAAQPSRRAPRGPDERAKAKAPAIGEGHRPPGRIDGRGRRAEQHLHPALGPEGCGPDQQSFEAFLPGQIVLRQSWPLVRQVRLGADDSDAPFKAVLAKRDRRLRAGMAAADDQHVERCRFDVRHRHCAPRCRFNPPSRRAT